MKYPLVCPPNRYKTAEFRRVNTSALLYIYMGSRTWKHEWTLSMPRHQEALPGNLSWRIPDTFPMWTRRKPLTKADVKGVDLIPTWQTSSTIYLWPILVFFFYVAHQWWIFVVCEKSLIVTTKGGSWIFWGVMVWICCLSVLGIWLSTPVIFPTLYSGLSALCV